MIRKLIRAIARGPAYVLVWVLYRGNPPNAQR